MTITSPKHSFVNFEGTLDGYPLPAHASIAVAFQFLFSADSLVPLTSDVAIGVYDLDHTLLYQHASLQAINVCAWGIITGVSFPMTIDAEQQLPVDTFASMDLFLAYLKTLGLSATGASFLQCCTNDLVDITFTFNSGSAGAVRFYRGLQQVTITENANTLFGTVPVAIDQCFQYGVSNGSDIVYSNTFTRVTNSKFFSRLTYSNNEDAYGFRYPSPTVYNQVLLHCYTRFPKFPETRKVYVKSTKQYKVLHATIEKEWEFRTEYMPDVLHEKMAVLLAHDNVHIQNDKMDSDIVKKDDYSIDWSADNEGSESAPASCKILQPFEGRNSNCETRPVCAVTIPDPIGPCAPQNITWEATDNGDGTQDIRFEFDPGTEPDFFNSLSISRSTDGITFTDARTRDNVSPQLYICPIGFFTFKFEVIAGCTGSAVVENVGAYECPDVTATPYLTGFELSWPALGFASGYRVEIYNDAAETSVIVNGTTFYTIFLRSGLASSTTYYYRISAVVGGVPVGGCGLQSITTLS